MKPRCLMSNNKKYIPPYIIEKCAEAAFSVTSEHYDGDESANLYACPLHVIRSVERDVRAVLIGGRNAEQLHEAWAGRKFKELNHDIDKVHEKYPTATIGFKYLTEHDRQGYELFVETVFLTYHTALAFFHAEKPLEKVNYRTAEALRKAADNSVSAQVCSDPGRYFVNVTFSTKEDALAFFRAL